ncbi:allose kinase [Dickeya oryzae]|uniref:allose kinase n=1 Tax=Dickeya oryzae TaxID=1240404 RepID=UPI001AECA60E|nr:allose kinase [Dickeya oryzae]
MMTGWLGVDIGGTSTRLLVMDAQRRWSGFHKVPTASWAHEPDALGALAQVLHPVLAAASCAIGGVMLGLPGILSHDRQQVVSLPFIPALDGQPVARQLAERVGVPVAMDKDVNHLMLWDLLQLESLPQHAVGIYLGTGLGNSLWINGQFYHGQHGGSGELGHIPWPDNPQACPCGNAGCVETITSGHWLSQWAQTHSPQTPLATLFSAQRDHPDLCAFIDQLAQAIATEMNILDPEYLILGGGVLSMADFPLQQLRSRLMQHLRPPVTRHGLKLVVSAATDHTGCRGACLAAERYFGK